MAGLYLVGVNHTDLNGKARLKRLLHSLRPEKILLEFDERRVAQATQLFQTLDARVNEARAEAVDAFETLGSINFFQKRAIRMFYSAAIQNTVYEFEVSKSYSERHNVPLLLCDSWLQHVPDHSYFKMIHRSRDERLGTIEKDPVSRKQVLRCLVSGSYRRNLAASINPSYDPEECLKYRFKQVHSYPHNQAKTQAQCSTLQDIDFHPEREASMANEIEAAHNVQETSVAIVGGAHVPYLLDRLNNLSPRAISMLNGADITAEFFQVMRYLGVPSIREPQYEQP